MDPRAARVSPVAANAATAVLRSLPHGDARVRRIANLALLIALAAPAVHAAPLAPAPAAAPRDATDSSTKGMPMIHTLPSAEEARGLPADGGPGFNRLVHERSPYLLQHARNPVDWYPWGPEAFARAAAEDKPVFLSVGYSTCHWCHVMERESFEKQAVAELMNANFICIKVDREERPDVDEIYMNATQLMTGHGGWPNSVWLAPDGRPWFAGTYFPPEDRYGRPGFKTILQRTAEIWKSRRSDIETQANQLAEAVRQASLLPEADMPVGPLNRDLIGRVLRTLERTFDERHGGFGGAPKFPPHGSLAILLHEYDRTNDRSILTTATRTLDAMALGGIHDHIGGGFHRYATDEEWFLPHFEKMLYDNAQLAQAYTRAFEITGEMRYRRVATDILDWVLRDMTSPEGGFFSALDADSEGEEGKFYLWTPKEVGEVLGKDEGEFFGRVYGIVPGGNYQEEATGRHPGSSLPFLDRPIADIARKEGVTEVELLTRLDADRAKLLSRRNDRVWPHLDDKILVAWNGLMIGALARAGRIYEEPRYTVAAERAVDFVLDKMRKDGRLLHSRRAGESGGAAFLDDYAFLIDGLLDLHESTRNPRFLEYAESLMGEAIRHYWDDRDGGFFFTPDDHEALLVRSKDPYDKAIPSGNGVAARALVRLASVTGEDRGGEYGERAERLFDAFLPVMYRLPRGAESLILSATLYLDGRADAARESRASGIGTAGDASTVRANRVDSPEASLTRFPLSLDLFLSKTTLAPGETIAVALRLVVDDGWHVNSSRPIQDYLVPTKLRLKETPSARLERVDFPPGENVALGVDPEPLSVYEGEVWIRATLTIGENVKPGSLPLSFLLSTQACDDRRCLAPELDELNVTVTLAPKGESGVGRHGKVFGGETEKTGR